MIKYIIFDILAKRSNSDQYLQLSEIVFNSISFKSATCTVDGREPEYPQPTDNVNNLIDKALNKMCIKANYCTIKLELEEPIEKLIGSYYYVTGNDYPERDPISWIVYTSEDGERKTIVDNRFSVSITQDRFAQTQDFVIGEGKGWWEIKNEELTFSRFLPIQESFKDSAPYAMWDINGEYPYLKFFRDIDDNLFKNDTPFAMWYVEKDSPYQRFFYDVDRQLFKDDTPYAMWYLDKEHNGEPYERMFLPIPELKMFNIIHMNKYPWRIYYKKRPIRSVIYNGTYN